MAVLFAHASAVFQVDGSPAFWSIPFHEQTSAQRALSLFSAFFNPSAAVVLFFVLSGYVLSLSLQRQRIDAAAASGYVLRRAFRLLPPMWVSIVLCFVVVRSPEGADFTDWYRAVFAGDANARDVVNNFALVSFKVNPATWTMFVEVVGSIFVLALAFFRRSMAVDLVGVVLLTWLTAYAYPSFSLSYLLAFHVGGVMTKVNGAIVAPRAIALLSISSFAFERLLYSSRPGSAVLLTAASALVILAVRSGAFQSALLSAPLRFVGRVSYSLYLLHLVVLYAAGTTLTKFGITGLPAVGLVLVFSIPLSLLLAWVSYSVVERWSIEVGQRLSRLISRARPIAG